MFSYIYFKESRKHVSFLRRLKIKYMQLGYPLNCWVCLMGFPRDTCLIVQKIPSMNNEVFKVAFIPAALHLCRFCLAKA